VAGDKYKRKFKKIGGGRRKTQDEVSIVKRNIKWLEKNARGVRRL
jgi:hypothetical protein